MKKQLICGVTGPSLYSPEVQLMIETELKAIPMFICQNDPDDLKWALDQCNFFVLAGGSDWSPTSYGGEMMNNENLTKFDFLRDKRELSIMDYAKNNEKKLLGICRGHQGIGVFHGLDLNLDITGTPVCHQPSAASIKTEGNPVHFVRCLPQFHEEFFDQELCNSWHHQALNHWNQINYENNGIEVIGLANLNYNNDKKKENKIIELMRTMDGLMLSSQWHIELDYSTNNASRVVLDKFKEMIAE